MSPGGAAIAGDVDAVAPRAGVARIGLAGASPDHARVGRRDGDRSDGGHALVLELMLVGDPTVDRVDDPAGRSGDPVLVRVEGIDRDVGADRPCWRGRSSATCGRSPTPPGACPRRRPAVARGAAPARVPRRPLQRGRVVRLLPRAAAAATGRRGNEDAGMAAKRLRMESSYLRRVQPEISSSTIPSGRVWLVLSPGSTRNSPRWAWPWCGPPPPLVRAHGTGPAAYPLRPRSGPRSDAPTRTHASTLGGPGRLLRARGQLCVLALGRGSPRRSRKLEQSTPAGQGRRGGDRVGFRTHLCGARGSRCLRSSKTAPGGSGGLIRSGGTRRRSGGGGAGAGAAVVSVDPGAGGRDSPRRGGLRHRGRGRRGRRAGHRRDRRRASDGGRGARGRNRTGRRERARGDVEDAIEDADGPIVTARHRGGDRPDGDGLEMSYTGARRSRWRQRAPTVVFVHGWCGDGGQWDGAAELGAGHRRGSHRTVRAAIKRARVERAALAMTSRGCSRPRSSRVVLVGHGMGGQVCLEVALRAPERVAAIVGVDCLGEAADPNPGGSNGTWRHSAGTTRARCASS